MLLFSAVLKINDTLDKEAFVRLLIRWNQENPYADNRIPNLEWNGSYNVRFGSENLWLAVEEYRDCNIVAARFEKREEDGVIWDTDYIVNFKEKKMAVRLDRSYTEGAESRKHEFSTPYFISWLIREDYLADDNGLEVLKRPHVVNEENAEQIAEVINGARPWRLPVIYVSKTYYDDDPVDVNNLASRVKGVAHVFVQDSTKLNPMLRELCDDNNEYYGAVGIYYPNPVIEHRRFLYRDTRGYDEYQMNKVIQAVISYSNVRNIDPLYTWQGVNNAIALARLQAQRRERREAEQARLLAQSELERVISGLDRKEEELRQKAEKSRLENEKLLESFDEDLKRMERRIEELSKENTQLEYENQALKAKLDDTEHVPLLYMGEEFEFYAGEIKDLLLRFLDEGLKRLPADSRRSHLFRDLIDHNDYQAQSEKRAGRLEQLFRSYDRMDSRTRQALKELGFEITEEGKHYKLKYYGDKRYVFSCSKTPSDRRSGMNQAKKISRKVF